MSVNPNKQRTCSTCHWREKANGICYIKDKITEATDSCNKHETDHEAEIYDSLLFGEDY